MHTKDTEYAIGPGTVHKMRRLTEIDTSTCITTQKIVKLAFDNGYNRVMMYYVIK